MLQKCDSLKDAAKVRFVERRCKSVSIKNVCEDEKNRMCVKMKNCFAAA